VGFFHGRRCHGHRGLARKHGVRIGSINPNFFQDQVYKFGSVCNGDEDARSHAHRHMSDCIAIAKAVGSDTLSLWFADGTNYPGQDDIVERKRRMHGALRQWHDALPPGMKMLVEYKPFEPAFYHTDIADWGMAYIFAKDAGPKGQGARGHRASSIRPEHRADRRVAAG
jgi:L-rhamnose isomerase / sugar isomerase